MSERLDPVSVIHLQFRKRILDEIAASLSREPLSPPMHEDMVDRTVHFLRSLPVQGKHMILGVAPAGPWKVGRVGKGAGAGRFLLGPEEYLTYGAAARAVFAERYAELLDEGQA